MLDQLSMGGVTMGGGWALSLYYLLPFLGSRNALFILYRKVVLAVFFVPEDNLAHK